MLNELSLDVQTGVSVKKWLHQTLHSSRITEKLTKRMLLVYVCIYITIFLLLLCILAPILCHKSMDDVESVTSLIQKEYSTTLNTLVGEMNSLATLPELSTLLSSYNDDSSKANNALIEQYMNSYRTNFENLKLIMLEDEEEHLFTSFNYSNPETISFVLNDENYHALRKVKYGSYYSPIDLTLFKLIDNTTPIPILFISKRYYINQKPYILTAFYDMTNTIQRSAIIADSVIDEYFILDKYNRVIYSTEDVSSEYLDVQWWNTYKSSGYTLSLSKMESYSKMIDSRWIIITITSYPTLLANAIQLFFIILSLYLALPILYCLFLIPANNRFLQPLKDLSDIMSAYSAGDSSHLEIHTDDEIEDLSHSFNEMVHKINQQIADIAKQERKSAITYYQLLATQIDPHFIYNTMNVINILARQEDTAAIIEVNTALSRILRERLNTKLTIFDTVENEIETLKQYNLIMDYRYQNSVNTFYDIDPSLLKENIPKNILQPIIENAFYHGLTDEEGKINGNIDLVIYALDNQINIEISDNGKGISPERLKELEHNRFHFKDHKKAHIGLENIQQRLEHVYHERFTMNIQSELGYGTTISLTLPFYNPAEDQV